MRNTKTKTILILILLIVSNFLSCNNSKDIKEMISKNEVLIKIYGTFLDDNEKGKLCNDFYLTKDEVVFFFKNAEIISFMDISALYDWLPCYIKGEFEIEGLKYYWEIRLIDIGKIITPNNNIIWFGFPGFDEIINERRNNNEKD